MDWFNDWNPMSMNNWNSMSITREEIDMTRMKAYLDFAETERVLDLKSDNFEFPQKYYFNTLGQKVTCKVLIERKNGEIIVENQNGCFVCLTEDKLFENESEEKNNT